MGRPEESQIAIPIVTLSTASATRSAPIAASASKASADPFRTITTLEAAALGTCALAESDRAEAAQSGRMRIGAPGSGLRGAYPRTRRAGRAIWPLSPWSRRAANSSRDESRVTRGYGGLPKVRLKNPEDGIVSVGVLRLPFPSTYIVVPSVGCGATKK